MVKNIFLLFFCGFLHLHASEHNYRERERDSGFEIAISTDKIMSLDSRNYDDVSEMECVLNLSVKGKVGRGHRFAALEHLRNGDVEIKTVRRWQRLREKTDSLAKKIDRFLTGSVQRCSSEREEGHRFRLTAAALAANSDEASLRLLPDSSPSEDDEFSSGVFAASQQSSASRISRFGYRSVVTQTDSLTSEVATQTDSLTREVGIQVEDDDTRCPVCLEHMIFGSDKRFSQLPCAHFFHNGCWVRWARRFVEGAPHCPLCRGSWAREELCTGLQNLLDQYEA